MRTAARAFFGDLLQIRKTAQQVCGLDVGEAECAHARRIDDESAGRERKRHRRRRRVPSSTSYGIDLPGFALGSGNECVDECGLADPGMPDQHRYVVDERVRDGTHVGNIVGFVDGGDVNVEVKVRVEVEEWLRAGQVCFGEAGWGACSRRRRQPDSGRSCRGAARAGRER